MANKDLSPVYNERRSNTRSTVIPKHENVKTIISLLQGTGAQRCDKHIMYYPFPNQLRLRLILFLNLIYWSAMQILSFFAKRLDCINVALF